MSTVIWWNHPWKGL